MVKGKYTRKPESSNTDSDTYSFTDYYKNSKWNKSYYTYKNYYHYPNKISDTYTDIY